MLLVDCLVNLASSCFVTDPDFDALGLIAELAIGKEVSGADFIELVLAGCSFG